MRTDVVIEVLEVGGLSSADVPGGASSAAPPPAPAPPAPVAVPGRAPDGARRRATACGSR